MGFASLAEIAERAKAEKRPFWRVVFEDDCVFSQMEPESSWNRMREMYQAMKAADDSYDENQKSASGLVGGDGARMAVYADAEKKPMRAILCSCHRKSLEDGGE